MPVNEILAPYYLRVTYQTQYARHNMTIYLGSGTLTQRTDGDWDYSRLGSLTVSSPATLSAFVSDYLAHLYSFQGFTIIRPEIVSIEVWQSVPSAPNTLIGYCVTPPPYLGGTIQPVASSYTMVTGVGISATGSRQTCRIMVMDSIQVASPQRHSWSLLNATIRDYLNDVFAKEVVVTQDGFKVIPRAFHFGYNRKLARAYGRDIVP